MINESIRIKRLAGIISEIEYNQILIFEQQTNSVDVLLNKAQQTGLDLNDKNVQLDIVDSLIDVNFNPEKVDVNSITEGSREKLEEEGGVVQMTVHALEDVETIEKIAHYLGVKVEYVKMAKKFIDGVVKVLGWPFKKIQALFYNIARLVGFDVEKSRVAGVGGLLLLGIAGIVYTIMTFPATISLITGGLAFKAVLKFLYTMFKSIAGIKGFVSNLFSAKKEVEDVNYTITDFFDDIKTKASKSLNVPFEWIYQFESWINHMDKEEKTSVMKKLMDLADFIKRGKNSGGHMNQVYRIAKRDGNEYVTNVLKTLNNTFNPHNQIT